MRITEDIRHYNDEFIRICKKHNVKSLYVFGSYIRDDFDENNSDIDFLVDINDDDPIERGEKLMSFWDYLEKFFNRKVDLLTYNSIKNPILKSSIDASKRLVYDGSANQIFD